nr:insulinase family protein [Desulfobaculum xiamenense]
MIHGFELLVEKEIPEVGVKARLFRHARTGAELMSLICPDENKVFGVSFRTPPRDSTGVPHILEHSVLCGSDRYPVKEPFVELLKGSLQTFLNAFTYPDKTCYPVASTNLQDFYNLVDVYIDAVFHPRIDESVFRQEGWHYELDSPEGELTRKGVVFNEMKGAYSSPDGLLQEHSQRGLFPDTTYGLDSGGDPERIPDLTHERFLHFHRTLYHPSNARFWFYGDDDENRRLEILAAALDGYDAITVDSEVEVQPRIENPRRIDIPYAGGDDARTMFTVNWLLPETFDRDLALRLEVLEHILIGLPSSPLRRALMESGLGEDLTGVGLEDELRQMSFSVGLKGMDAEDVAEAEGIIFDVLRDMADNGPSIEMVEAAMNSVEFDLREQNTGRFPRGLSLMLMSLTTWLHGGDPFVPLAFEASLRALKTDLAAGRPVFSELVRSFLLDNAHRTTVVLEPKDGLAAERDRREREELAARKAAMTPEEIETVIRTARELREAQERPDSPEALATIPTLSLDDIAREEKIIPTEEREVGGVRTLLHDLPAQGIVYLDAGFDLGCVAQEDLPLVPLFGRALFEMGTQTEDFASLTMRVARKTGGIEPETFVADTLDREGFVARLFLRGKAMAANTGDMLDILRDVLLTARFEDRERFRLMALEEKARLEERLIPAGHMVALTRLRARHGMAGWLGELMGGVSALTYARQLIRDIDADWNGVLERLERIRRAVVSRRGLLLNVTAAGHDLPGVVDGLSSFVAALPESGSEMAQWLPGTFPEAEGLAIPAQVNYVGRIVDLAQAGYEFSGAHLAVNRHARMGYLWDRVRVQGGAYGAFSSLDRAGRTMAFASYRDPNLDTTIDVFNGTGEYFRTLRMDREELVKSIIGAVGEVDTYLLPDAQGYVAMARLLMGDTPEMRQTMRDELLGTTLADFNAFGELLASVGRTGSTVVIGSGDALAASAAGLEVKNIL